MNSLYLQNGKLVKLTDEQKELLDDDDIFASQCSNGTIICEVSGVEYDFTAVIPKIEIISSALIESADHLRQLGVNKTDSDTLAQFKPLVITYKEITPSSECIGSEIFYPLAFDSDTYEYVDWNASLLHECQVKLAVIQEHSKKYWTDDIKDDYEEHMEGL